MEKFITVKTTTGECINTIIPAVDGMYTHGQVVDDKTILKIPFDSNDKAYMSGKYWDGEEWKTKPERPSSLHFWSELHKWKLNVESLLLQVRVDRDIILASTDWTQMPDAPLTAQQRAEWAIYRQALRDVPQNNANVASLDEVQWPSKPEA